MADTKNTYFRDHWVDVEPERMARYEAMFQWREGNEALIMPAAIREGQVVADFGCGPGGLALELARRVGDSGRVFGLDINSDFLTRVQTLAEQEGLAGRIETRLLEDESLPLPDESVDRVLCKNVLEYVPDPLATLREFRRIIRPGGIVHVTDSDWGAVIFEPASELFARVMAGAGIAFQTPLIGRRLYGMFRGAGFDDIQVQVLASAETSGALAPVLRNMASYARTSGVPPSEVEKFIAVVDRSLNDSTYFAVLPQFLVTGSVPD